MKKLYLVSFALVVGLWLPVAPAMAQEAEHVLGFGLGIPYGVLGANYEIGLNEYVAGTVGLGLAIEGLGWFAGGRLYYPASDKFRARLTAGYGVTGIVTGFGSDTLTGFAGGPGLDWRYGEKWSFQADVLFITTEDVPENADELGGGGNVKIALGFARRF
jgi:hypothetical protein